MLPKQCSAARALPVPEGWQCWSEGWVIWPSEEVLLGRAAGGHRATPRSTGDHVVHRPNSASKTEQAL